MVYLTFKHKKIPGYITRDKHKDITLAIIARGISQHNHFSRRSIALLAEAGRNPSGIGRLLVKSNHLCSLFLSFSPVFLTKCPLISSA